MEERARRIFSLTALLLFLSPFPLLAATPEEVQHLQEEIASRRASIETINRQLDEYRAKIQEYSQKTDSLFNDVALLENELAMAELDVVATRAELEATQLELEGLDAAIVETDTRLTQNKANLQGIIFSLHAHEARQGGIDSFLASENFFDAFRTQAQLESVNDDLQQTLVATQRDRENLGRDRVRREEKLEGLVAIEDDLERKLNGLEARKVAKEVLISETNQSESQYRELLAELRSEQRSITNRISALEDQVAARLRENGEGEEGDSAIAWPLRGIITTLFHDPTYPFRHLFEHSGFDIAIPQGTAVTSSAPGVVAWAKTGSMYGNYVMIIHADGMATLYAHMSRMDVVADQYVSRGETIGLSGGRPGTPGAGFSTGPHLHFEVRKDGIPVDPRLYLSE